MAGIYVHIPYCKQACHYCDFHFSTQLESRSDMMKALIAEIVLQKEFFKGHKIETIYFGGGTPSILNESELTQLLEIVSQTFPIDSSVEITLEANPDDLDSQKLQMFKSVGINRLSIGIQSFQDSSLKFMNRSHDSKQAKQCIETAKGIGFQNISLDLIYAIPFEGYSMETLTYDIETLMHFHPKHISIYGMTIEPKTVFGDWVKKKKLEPTPDGTQANQYDFIVDRLTKANYEQYEVSNFGKSGFHSRHNSAYWKGIPYLGIGPGAHSYNGECRFINISNNHKYINAITSGDRYQELEKLTMEDEFNEYILTRLRTKWGVDLNYVLEFWAKDLQKEYVEFIESLIKNQMAELNHGVLKLTPRGFRVADEIALRFFS